MLSSSGKPVPELIETLWNVNIDINPIRKEKSGN